MNSSVDLKSKESTPTTSGFSTKSSFKYKIGKVRQTAPILIDPETGLDFIQLKPRPNKLLYGVTKFDGCYSSDALLGKGTFGEVFKGIHIETQRAVAIKKLLVKSTEDVFPITAQREIIILKKLQHKNIIKLIEVIYDETTAHNKNGNSGTPRSGQSTASNAHTNSTSFEASNIPTKAFFMVLPYMVSDLAGVLHNPHINLNISDIKNMLLQILDGIDYLHKMKYMHRDIKSANILIDHKGTLKLADFGLARNYYGAPPNMKFPGGAGVKAKYTSVVVTRWYRAPELVLGDKFYTTAVDIWGIGCVFAEFFIKSPVLQGKTDIDQGHVIFKLMGSPTEETWPTYKYLAGKSTFEKTNYPPLYRETFGKYLDEDGLDLLSKMLCLDPYQRITSVAAKHHIFFKNDPLPSKSLGLPAEESHESDIERFKKLRKAIEQKQKIVDSNETILKNTETKDATNIPATRALQDPKAPVLSRTLQDPKTAPVLSRTLQDPKTAPGSRTLQDPKTAPGSRTLQDPKTVTGSRTLRDPKTAPGSRTLQDPKLMLPSGPKVMNNSNQPLTVQNETSDIFSRIKPNDTQGSSRNDTQNNYYRNSYNHRTTYTSHPSRAVSHYNNNNNRHYDSSSYVSATNRGADSYKPEHSTYEPQNQKSDQSKTATTTTRSLQSGTYQHSTNGDNISSTSKGPSTSVQSQIPQRNQIGEMPVSRRFTSTNYGSQEPSGSRFSNKRFQPDDGEIDYGDEPRILKRLTKAAPKSKNVEK